jgi:hypothetical protein
MLQADPYMLPLTWVTNGRIRDGFESEGSVQYVHRQPSGKTRASNSPVFSTMVLQYFTLEPKKSIR